MTNILKAIHNMLYSSKADPSSTPLSNNLNRINQQGAFLEHYIKDLFCNSFDCSEQEKLELYNKKFSYIGNQNNPPDIMIREGDAIEIKKIQKLKASIALNSSYPKSKLYADSPMITRHCRDCEKWNNKDIVYVIASIPEKEIKSIWFVYGDCYAADKKIYESIKSRIHSEINEIKDVELSRTKELARINRVDPLGITNLRVRGMWHIAHPSDVFHYLKYNSKEFNFNFNAIVLKKKYARFPKKDRSLIETKAKLDKDFCINSVKIKSPDNPAKLLDAYHLHFHR